MKLNIDDEQGIELLHFIFERELKPPFRKAKQASGGVYRYYNRDGNVMGYLGTTRHILFDMAYDPFMINIGDKVCQVFGFSYDNWDWWYATEPHLKSWLENQLNVELHWLR